MAVKPVEPGEEGRQQSRPPSSAEGVPSELERVGPLELERARKADGRALLLFSTARPRR